MIALRSISKKLEDEINNLKIDDEVKELAYQILSFEIENFDKNNITYTNEIEKMIDLTRRKT